jgi:5-methyltetrahydrofolate--homocysteine methyltransferase
LELDATMNTDLQQLSDALVSGDHKRALAITQNLRRRGVEVEEIIRHGIQPAMEALDNKCTVEQFNLLEIMLTGRAVSAVARELFPDSSCPPNAKATIVVAALEGDIHDIGKHILKMVLIGNRYSVIDCGKDVPVTTVAERVKSENADALCISGLITNVIPRVRLVRQALKDAGVAHVPVLAGGAALKQSTAAALNVDYVGQTAFDAVKYLEPLFGEEQREQH